MTNSDEKTTMEKAILGFPAMKDRISPTKMAMKKTNNKIHNPSPPPKQTTHEMHIFPSSHITSPRDACVFTKNTQQSSDSTKLLNRVLESTRSSQKVPRAHLVESETMGKRTNE